MRWIKRVSRWMMAKLVLPAKQYLMNRRIAGCNDSGRGSMNGASESLELTDVGATWLVMVRATGALDPGAGALGCRNIVPLRSGAAWPLVR